MKAVSAILIFYVFMLPAISSREDICDLPTAVDGNYRIVCLANIPAYSYDKQKKECVPFVYGGCGGNDNRFETLEECEKRCKITT